MSEPTFDTGAIGENAKPWKLAERAYWQGEYNALEKYGEHLPGCNWESPLCSCGLSARLAEARRRAGGAT
jgi:hypothetical protein